MNEYVSFHTVLDLIEQFQQESPILNSYGYGNLVDFSRTISGDTQNTPVKYPYLFAVPMTVEYSENTTIYQVSLIFTDIINTDYSNEKDIISDMSLQARRFLSYVKRGIETFPDLYNNLDIELPVQAIPFMERMGDHVAGVAMDVNLIVFEDINACDYYLEPEPVPIWVATGRDNNTLGYSYDGINWSASTNGNTIFSYSLSGSSQAYNVGFGNNMWVACGQLTPNTLGYSYDGITWSASTNGNSIFSASCLDVSYNGNLWVAGGDGINTLGYSNDGITWSASTNGNIIFSGNSRCFAWNGNLWVAGGRGINTLGYSYDGITWSASTNSNSIISFFVTSVAWNGTLWVAGGRGTNTLAYSYDGITWSASTNGNSINNFQVFDVAWDGTKFVAVGNPSGGVPNGSIAYSYDGITWSASTNGASMFGYGLGVAWNGNLWVATGQTPNKIAYSNDGITWTASTQASVVFDSFARGIASNPAPNLYPPR